MCLAPGQVTLRILVPAMRNGNRNTHFMMPKRAKKNHSETTPDGDGNLYRKPLIDRDCFSCQTLRRGDCSGEDSLACRWGV